MSGTSISAISVSLGVDDTTLQSGLKSAGSRINNWSSQMIQGMTKAFQTQQFEQSVIDRMTQGSNEIIQRQLQLARDEKRNRVQNEIDNLSKVADYRKQMMRWELEHIRTVNEAAAKAARDPSISKENMDTMRFLGGGKSPRQVAAEEAEAAMFQDLVNERKSQALSLIKSLTTEQQKYNRKLEEYNLLLEQGFITKDQYKAAKLSLGQDPELKYRRQVQDLLNQQVGTTDNLVALQQRLKAEAREFLEVLNKTNLSERERKELAEQFVAAQSKRRLEARAVDSDRQQARANDLLRQAETVQERYNRRLAELNTLRATENIRTKQAMLTEEQYARLKAKLIEETKQDKSGTRQQAIDKIRQILASTGNEQAKINLLTANQKKEVAELNKAMEAAGVSLKQQAIQRRILLQHHKEELDLLRTKKTVTDKTTIDQDARLAEQVIRRNLTAQEAHNQRLADYARLLGTVNKATGKNYLTLEQYNRAVAESIKIMNSSRGGLGAYTGMMTQASFAIEDFIQGVAFGDIRSGILGASNNLTMVARGALQASEGMTILGMSAGKFMAVALGLPAAVIGVGAAFSWLNRAERDTRSLTDALKDAEHGFDRLRAAQDRREHIQQQHREIANIKDMESHDQKRVLLLEQQENIRRRMEQEEAKTTRLGSEMLLNTIGGKDAEAELRQLIHSLRNSGNEMAAAMGTNMEKALGDAFGAARRGEVEKMINALRVLNSLGYQMQQNLLTEDFTTGGVFADLQNLINDPTALDSLQAIFNTGFLMQTEDRAKLRELRDEMVSINKEKLKLQEDTKANAQALQELEERRLEIQKEMKNLEEQAEKVQRSKIEGIIVEEQIRRRMALEAMKMTEEQRRTAELQQEMNEFIGFDPMAMAGLGLQGMLAAGQGQVFGLQFLQAKADQLQKEMDKATQTPVIQGALEKDAFKAQADALKQAMQAINKKPDPQLEAQRALLQQIRDAIASGNVFFQGIP